MQAMQKLQLLQALQLCATGLITVLMTGLMTGLISGLITSAAVAAPTPDNGLHVTDDRGVTVHWATTPQRVVSLLPSLTESICALGQCPRLVGVDRYSDWPASIEKLPRLGGGLDPNVEAIVALRPDVVVLAKSSKVIARLESLGLKVLALEPHNYADVQRVLNKLAQVLGLPASASALLWQEIEAGVAAAAQSLPARMQKTRVYFEVGPAPYGAGTSSFIGETLSRLKVQNILTPALGAFPKLNPEWIVRANPDVIMVGEGGWEQMRQRPGWSGIRAVREQRWCAFTQAQANILVRPGPRMAQAAQSMARCLQEKAP
jgi:iron complex transport system substrate-binding protein